MTITATIVDDPRLWRPRVRRQEGGWIGTRYYRINSRDPGMARKATGLPKRGDSWGDDEPDLRVVSIDVEPLGGEKSDPIAGGGWSIAQVRYETAGISVLGPHVYDGQLWTRISTSVVTRPQELDVVTGEVIREGQGATVEDAIVEATVYHYRSTLPSFATFFAKMRTVNQAPLELPNVEGKGKGITFAAGEVRYRHPEIGSRDNLIEVAHHFALAPDHKFRWVAIDDRGEVADDPKVSDVYVIGDLGGLW